ncbi:MAG: class I SAM-dependent methyltransferase [Acidobacteriota bacterium]
MSAAAGTRAEPCAPGGLAALAWRRVRDALGRLPEGSLHLLLPDGSSERFGPGEGPSVTLEVSSWRLFRRLALAGDVGFGEGYMAGEWRTDDLPGLLRLFIRAGQEVQGVARGTAALRLARRLLHLSRRATRSGSRRNVAAHYDLSNDFYRFWLDPSMTYSCAIFAHPEEPLELAQRRKLERVARLAGLGAGQRVLEIGCGWGSFLELAASRGCDALGLTLSPAQASHARARLAAAGLPARVELVDYRDCGGVFDAVVSIEMLEAVGHARLPEFFAALDRLLAPGGVAVIQSITIPDHRYRAYRRNPDFIQKHIFPGGHLPSLAAIAAALVPTRLVIDSLENIGPHYALTLRRWREAFLEQRPAIRALGFDDTFLRRWEYYLAYCEAGFAERVLGDLQLTLRRAGEPPRTGATP